MVLSLRGHLDALNTNAVIEMAEIVKKNRIRVVIFDLENVPMVDSSGIGAMVALLKYTRAEGGDTVIAHLDTQPREVFRILNLNKAIKIYDTVDDALADLRPGGDAEEQQAVS